MIYEPVKCPACSQNYHRVSNDPFFALCFMCREDFGCTTPEQVKEIITWMDTIKPEERSTLLMGRKDHTHRGGHQSHHATPHVPYKAPDKEKVAAGIRALTQYGLTTPLQPGDMTGPTAYVLASNGLFEVRHSDIADVVLPLSPPNTSILGLTERLDGGVRMNLPKVPFEMLRQTVAFFRGVVTRFNNAEAIVRIWWNVADQAFEIRVPDGGQRVSGARVEHNDVFDLTGERDADGNLKYIHVMDIHSHNSMSGFWSGVDDADERKAPEGRMFGVLGKVIAPVPDWKWRMRSRDGFIELKVSDVFAVPDQKVDFTYGVPLKDLLVAQTVTASMTCTDDFFADATCPEEWYATVNQNTGRKETTTTRVAGFLGFGRWSNESKAPTVPSFIFVQAADGSHIAEYEVLGATATPTGVKILINGGKLDGTDTGKTTR